MRHSRTAALIAGLSVAVVWTSAPTAQQAAIGRAGWPELQSVGVVRAAEPSEAADWIEGASRRFRSRLTPDYRLPIAIDFVLTQNLALPPNLPAGNVLVPRGVTVAGDPGLLCLFFIDGFKASADRCYGEAAAAVERLTDLDRHPAPRSCRVLSPDATTSVQAVSVDAPAEPSSERRAVQVHVARPGEVLLVLNSAAPVDWRVTFARGALVRGVIVTGSAASNVDGFDPGMPLLTLDEKTRGLLARIDSACAPFVAEAGPAIRGGPDTLILDRQVRAITGRGLDGLHGGRQASRVDVR
jgi:hypothetical protein